MNQDKIKLYLLRDLYKRTLDYSGELINLINTIHNHIVGEWGLYDRGLARIEN
jgi:hypothetical protein